MGSPNKYPCRLSYKGCFCSAASNAVGSILHHDGPPMCLLDLHKPSTLPQKHKKLVILPTILLMHVFPERLICFLLKKEKKKKKQKDIYTLWIALLRMNAESAEANCVNSIAEKKRYWAAACRAIYFFFYRTFLFHTGRYLCFCLA